MNPEQEREEVIRELAGDRVLAHRFLFQHRHPNADPDFHAEIITSWHDPAIAAIVTEAFREGAKSTRAEEVVIIRAELREFRNGLVVGASEEMACDRLKAIRHELETNEKLLQIFGDPQGPTWTDHKIELKNGIVIQARGLDQKMRGTKHHDIRPDFCLIDDIEDEETVATPQQRKKTLTRLYKTLLPALDKNAMIRMIGNRLHEEAAIVEVSKDAEWLHQRYPIKYRDETGAWKATWPDRFPLEWIDRKEAQLRDRGLLREFKIEYMVEAAAAEEHAFRREHILIRPQARIWQATWAMYDPARTVTKDSATTGFACWSWVGHRLVIWRAWGKKLKPSEIIASMFDVDNEFRPVVLGVEEDGLNEWLMQPLRSEIAKRRHALPLRAMSAPRDKSKAQFIRGLEPFFNAGEVEFAEDDAETTAQFLGFPTGNIDIPNAIAYSLRMRPGAPIYDDFRQEHIVPHLSVSRARTLWLVMNATAGCSTGVLAQFSEGLRIIADWVEEGEPALSARAILAQAQLESGGADLRVIAPPIHFDRFNNVGLRQALTKAQIDLNRGAMPDLGREEMRDMLRTYARETPRVLVAHRARWVLNGLSGGYARDAGKNGQLADHARDGIYRTLMEGIESFLGLLEHGLSSSEGNQRHYAETENGTRYLTARPR